MNIRREGVPLLSHRLSSPAQFYHHFNDKSCFSQKNIRFTNQFSETVRVCVLGAEVGALPTPPKRTHACTLVRAFTLSHRQLGFYIFL